LGTRTAIDRSFSFSAKGFLDATWSWDQQTSRILAECRYADTSGNGNLQHRVTVTNVSTAYQSQPPTSNPCFADINSWGGTIDLNNDVFGESHGYSRGVLTS
jgi:hypothetical protein